MIPGNLTFTPVRRRDTSLFTDGRGADPAMKAMWVEAMQMIKDHFCVEEIASKTGLPSEAIRVYQQKLLQPFDAWWCGLERARQQYLMQERWSLAEAAFKAGFALAAEHRDIEPSCINIDNAPVESDEPPITIMGDDLPQGVFATVWDTTGFK